MAHKTAMIEAIKFAGSEFPELVFEYYLAEKIIKYSAHDGFSLVHGCFLDADVIARADNQVRADYDPTPYCHVCNAMTQKQCDCPQPFYAENH
jgi:hypothetical protein